jgi:hypothetical protein
MASEVETLRNVNVDIGNKESDGDADYFRTLLAPEFAMRRASGEFCNRDDFVDAVKESPGRQTEDVSITMYGDTSAVVTCIVLFSMGAEVKRFYNLRLFVRSGVASQWQLLAWSNERVT